MIVVILGAFVYGVGVGEFSWPPRDTLRDVYVSVFYEYDDQPIIDRFIGYEILIKTGNHSEIGFIMNTGKDDTGYYIELKEPLNKPYPAASELRLSDNEYLSEIKGSLDDFRNMGFTVRHFSYPWNAYDDLTRELVSEHYYSARAGGGFDGYERGVNIPHQPLRTYALYSRDLDIVPEESVTAMLDETIKENGLCIVYFHSDRTTERRIRHLIETAIDKNIDIITRSEAFERFANPGDYAQEPALVIEYDDSPWTDYALAFPIHQDQDKAVPGNIAAVSNRIDTPGYLTIEQMQEMVDAGWEVVSHSRSHAYLKSVLYTSKKASPNDSRIYVSVSR